MPHLLVAVTQCRSNEKHRKLATSDKSRVSIHVTKKMTRAGGVDCGGPLKFVFSFVKKMVAVCRAVWAYVGDSKNWRAEAPPLERWT